jgi:hypothetical protein
MFGARLNTLLSWLAHIGARLRRAISRTTQPKPESQNLERGQVI